MKQENFDFSRGKILLLAYKTCAAFAVQERL
jgi:hypothetical protein